MTRNRTQQRGLTLVELMIAIALSMLIVAALASLYINSSRSFREDDQYARMLENGRFAIHFLADDLQMADFWGYYMLSDFIGGADTETVCGVNPYQTKEGTGGYGAVEFVDGDLTTPCSTEIAAGGRQLLIRRVGGARIIGATTLEPGRAYLETAAKLRDAAFVDNDTTTSVSYTVPGPNALWEYRSVLYYLDGGQLCRRSFEFNPPQNRECLVGGVTAWELLWSIDNSGDGRADKLVINPSPVEMRGAVGVRVCLLLESEKPISGYTNDKIYTLCGVPQNGNAAYGDGHQRRVFEKNLELRNGANAVRFRNL